MKSILSLLLFTPLLAWGQAQYFGEAACNEYFNQGQDRNFESAVVRHLETRDQAFQLLFDYGFIFSKNHDLAVKTLLMETSGVTGITFEDQVITAVDLKARGKQLDKLDQAFQQLLKNPSADRVLDTLVTLSSESGEVDYAKTRNLLAEMRKLPESHVLRQTFERYNELVLARSYLELLQLRKSRINQSVARPIRWPPITIGRIILMEVALEVILRVTHLNESKAWNNSGLNLWSRVLLPMFYALPSRVNIRSFRIADRIRRLGVNQDLRQFQAELSSGRYFEPHPGLLQTSSALNPTRTQDAPERLKSIQEAAALTDISGLTPVDVAYLGHQEKLELQSALDQLVADFDRDKKVLDELRAAALDLEAHLGKAHVEVYPRQVRLEKTLHALLGARDEAAFRTEWKQFEDKIQQLKSWVTELEGLAPSRRDPWLNQQFEHQLKTDLQQIQEMEVDAQALQTSLDQWAQQRQEVQRILNQLKDGSSDWQGAIDDVLLLLEGYP